MKHYLPNGSYIEVLRSTAGKETIKVPYVEGEWKVVDEENATTTDHIAEDRKKEDD